MAEDKKTEMIDPIAYRPDYPKENIIGYDPMADLTPEYLENMDYGKEIGGGNQSFSQYGDDSSPDYQNKSKGGLNDKYSGEGVKNDQLNYDANLMLKDLNPNFVYGLASKVYGTDHPGYITQRNDQIASALYNEGKTSKDDVAYFLGQQKGWMNSSEADRGNTIEAIYKRLGAIAEQNPKEGEVKDEEEGLNTPIPSDVLYGKVGTEEDGTVVANVDKNAILNQMDSGRIANANALSTMQPNVAAAATYQGQTPYGSQALRDVQISNPDWYNQYQQELKKLYTQDEINNISHGSAETGSGVVESTAQDINNNEKTWKDQNINNDNAEYANSSYQEKLNNNKTAMSAKEQMSQIKMDIVDLQDEIDGLEAKANRIFPADTPDYIVQGYISNNAQELNKKIKNLENKFLSLSDIYKTEVGNIQWEMEYQLKVDAANREAFNDEWERYYKEAQLENDLVQWGKDANGNIVGFKYDPKTNTMRQVTDGEAYDSYNNAVSKVSAKAKSYVGKSTGKQCLGFTNMLTKETAGVTMQSADGGEVLAKDRIAYATDPNVSDYIPVVGDVAVGVGGPYNSYYGHTMYVDNVYTDQNGDVWFHYIATNDGKHEDKTIAYEGNKRVKDFYANGGVGFWNPFKQAQYNNRGVNSSNQAALQYSPMQPAIDTAIEKANGKIGLLDNLGNFQEAYTAMYELQKTGQMEALINEGTLQQMVQMVANDWATANSGENMYATNDGKKIKSFFELPINQALNWLSNEAAQKYGDDEAYRGLLAVMRLIQIKLRDESGAVINDGEWSTDFNLYLPKPGDTSKTKYQKVHKMEEFVRAMATKCGITSKDYVQLFPVVEEQNKKGKRIYK